MSTQSAAARVGVSPRTLLRLGWQAPRRRRPVPVVVQDADEVRDRLTRNQETPLSVDVLTGLTGLSADRVVKAVGYLRDEGQDLALVTTSQGYVFTASNPVVDAFRVRSLRRASTGLRRLQKGVIVPALPSMPPEAQRLIMRGFNRLLEDLDAIETTAIEVAP
jgi:hypothetical protein